MNQNQNQSVRIRVAVGMAFTPLYSEETICTFYGIFRQRIPFDMIAIYNDPEIGNWRAIFKN